MRLRAGRATGASRRDRPRAGLPHTTRRPRLPDPEEERALRLPSGVPVTRNIRTAYAGDQPVEVLDTIAHGEIVTHRFELQL